MATETDLEQSRLVSERFLSYERMSSHVSGVASSSFKFNFIKVLPYIKRC
jgi:hypothetical protein